MIYNIIPIVIAVIFLTIITIIIVRKFPELKALDVDSIPEERQAKVKNQIIDERVNRASKNFFNKIGGLIFPAWTKIKDKFRLLFQKVAELEKKYEKKENVFSDVDKKNLPDVIREGLKQAEQLKDKEQHNEAEKKYIEIISLDPKNLLAYEGLAKVYVNKKEYDLAKETYIYLLKAVVKDKKTQKPQIAQYYFDLAEIFKVNNNLDKCLNLLKKVIEYDPNNPKYLDFYIDISIMLKQKFEAIKILKHLRKINPDNKKIKEFEKRIREID